VCGQAWQKEKKDRKDPLFQLSYTGKRRKPPETGLEPATIFRRVEVERVRDREKGASNDGGRKAKKTYPDPQSFRFETETSEI